jgi:hypothetical protein
MNTVIVDGKEVFFNGARKTCGREEKRTDLMCGLQHWFKEGGTDLGADPIRSIRKNERGMTYKPGHFLTCLEYSNAAIRG